MTREWPLVPRAAGITALLLTGCVLVLVSAWPERPEFANTAWYPLTALRATALAAWAWTLGWAHAHGPRAPVRDLLRPALGALVTAPIEAFAHAASAPVEPLAWSLAAPLLLAWALYGLAWPLAAALRRLGPVALAAPLALGIAAGLVVLDGRLGLGWWTPWAAVRTPDAVAAAVLAAASAAAWIAALRETRREAPEPLA